MIATSATTTHIEPNWIIEKAQFHQIGKMKKILQENLPYISVSTVRSLASQWRHYWVIKSENDDTLIGLGALITVQANTVELRGIAIANEYRQQKFANTLIDKLISHAKVKKLNLVCVTRLPTLFKKFGFVESIPFWLQSGRPQLNQNARLPESKLPPRKSLILPAETT